jgi:hypothetical protein
MKSPFYFIVKPLKGSRYDNKKEIGGVEIITSVSKEDHKHSNRFGVVEELPLGYNGPIKKGDLLLVHHNVFKFYYDMKGRERSSHNFFKDDLFFVDDDQYFMFYDGVSWKAHGKYCFVAPIPKKEYFLDKPGNEEPLIGVLRFSNDELKSFGYSEGDEVLFEPDSEYEFVVNGEKLYRMFTKNIMGWMTIH